MKKSLTAIAGAFDRADLVFLFGLGLTAYGLYAIYWPLACIVPGVVLTAVGAFGAVQRSKVQGSTSEKPEKG